MARDLKSASLPRLRPDLDFDVVVIGAGFGGIGAGESLLRSGISSFAIFEQAESVGGTWRDNTYPGCACDIPSHLYSLSFSLNPEWTRSYPAQPEIETYLERTATEFDLRPHLRFGREVSALRWIDEDGCWAVSFADGAEVRAGSVIGATGPLRRPAMPKIAGLESFEGEIFHSARWHHDIDLAGKRVGVIGTGASAVQFVPEIAAVAGNITVFQRTPPWILPRDDRPSPQWRRTLYRRIPALQRLHRWRIYFRQEMLSLAFIGRGRIAQRLADRIKAAGRELIDASISDPAEQLKLVPEFEPGCKRLLITNDWYPALARPNVEVVTDSIEAIAPTGVVAGGVIHECDVLIAATGFAATEFLAPLRIFGRNGEEITDHWRNGARTHMGMTISGFPNLYLLAGPSTGLGHNSIVFMIEAQLRYVRGALGELRRSGAVSLELDDALEGATYDEMQRRLAKTVWTSGCGSWYRSDDGRVDTMWPGTTIEYWWRTRTFPRSSYRRDFGRFGGTPAGR